MLVPLYADGVGTHSRLMPVAENGEVLPVGSRLQCPVDRSEKVVAVRLQMKTDAVCAQQSVDQLRLPRADAEGFRIGPGNVPEDGHTHAGTGTLDDLRQKSKVVILHED